MIKTKANLAEIILWGLFLLCTTLTVSAQVKKTFEPRYQENIRGDLTFIANSIVNRDDASGDPETAYNLTGSSSDLNDFLNMQYIDVDGDTSTFSSSSATFTLTDPNCSKVRYAGLYWGAVYPHDGDGNPNTRSTGFDQVKIKLPGGTYQDITADEIIFDGYGDSDFGTYSPYICYKDVTGLITPLADPQGEYTVANVLAAAGDYTSVSGGISAGWTLVIVFENPTVPAKNIATFDGYAGIKAGETVDIPFSGFNTLPNPFPVNATLGVGALEGDNDIAGDALLFKADSNTGFTTLGDAFNPSDNFFNSSISQFGSSLSGRTPNSINTLGWDTDLLEIDNPSNSVIPNNETGATLRATSTGDKYDLFFTSLAIENIEPDIQLTNTVEDLGGNNIDGASVALGQEMYYVITFDNTGNDDATNFTLRDQLPVNVDPLFNEIIFPDNGDQIQYNFDSATREITFQIPDSYVEVAESAYTIKIRVKVLEDCFGLRDACANVLENLVYGTYRGVINDNIITDDPGATEFGDCRIPSPGATNYIDLTGCNLESDLFLCGSSIMLNAGNGFTTYQWQYLDDTGTFINITGADSFNFEATAEGTYRVIKTIASPCISGEEVYNVYLADNGLVNPVINQADEVVSCSADGTPVPQFYFCSADEERALSVSINNSVSLEWQKLDGGCSQEETGNCPVTSDSCTWSTVATGEDFTLDAAGEYRLAVTFDNGCITYYPFRAYDYAIDPVLEIWYDCTDNSSSNEVVIALSNPGITDVIYSLDGGPDQFVNSFKDVAPGTHSITASYQGCQKTLNFEIDAISPVELSLANRTFNLIEMQASGGVAPYTFYVNGEYRGEDTDYRIRETGTYEVVVVDANGCESRAEITLEFYDISISNFFTPNGDNNNDTWGPSNSQAYPSIKTIVYDRYGRVVGEMRAGQFWDGTYNGSELPSGDYWYVVSFDEGEDVRDYVGHFTLYR
ncbi:T9SS type B sorting domain-containing protein [Robertkochia flava]|uniref:T9SS type B sorting domain-containing protein n=1 Tax=Robertkochia flava TaxID=3447986 RepID=UPI001CCBD0ED|nr:T9SS type B sorting domain-containing protein [Robertkochia marina]